jgi:hypothetical protein
MGSNDSSREDCVCGCGSEKRDAISRFSQWIRSTRPDHGPHQNQHRYWAFRTRMPPICHIIRGLAEVYCQRRDEGSSSSRQSRLVHHQVIGCFSLMSCAEACYGAMMMIMTNDGISSRLRVQS